MRIFQSISIRVLTVAVLAGAAPLSVAEQTGGAAPADGQWLQQKLQTCASCHGPKGVSTIPNNPVIAGQYRDYLEYSLTAYRDGKRKNPIMAAQAKGLSDAQIRALADYYSRQESPLHIPSINR